MEFFNSAIEVLQTLVVALGAGLGVWGGVNLLEGYGSDNPGSKKNGVKLMSATEIISDGPEGIILESVLEGYAEYYSADLSEKVVRGMTENALKGKYNGGAVPIGYVIDAEQHFQPDALTAPFVAEAFKRYNEGATMTEIRDWLNEHHVKNPRGGPMTYNTVQHMLNNRRYIGELKYRDILVAEAIPPLVSSELFQEVQGKMAKNKKAPTRRKAEEDYLLTTKLFCGHCGALMFGESGTSRTGDVHRYYKCAAAKKRKSCNKKTVRKQWLEALEAQKKDLEARIAEEKLAKPVMKEEFVRFWLLHFRKLDLSQKEQRQALVDTFINAIYLYDDKVLITFNYKEGTETVSFSEATEAVAKEKSSDMDCLGAPQKRWIFRSNAFFLCLLRRCLDLGNLPRKQCRFVNEALHSYTEEKESRICLGERQLRGRIGKLL